MKNAWTALRAAATCALLVALPVVSQAQSIRGFSREGAAAQFSRERTARAVPRPDTLRETLRILSEKPHEAGTDRSKAVAEMILSRFKSYGLDARIEMFEALMPRPVSRTLELVAPTRFTAKLKEPCIAEDKDSCDADQIPTFNAYSPDGDVTGDLVYVNYGVPADYKVLDSLGISVKGKIVIARYGGSWRGIKPKVAAEHGAIACIIYSDPRDDGFFVGDVYPKGSMRNPDGVQRGSAMDMPRYPGDPLSPGWASEPGARKLAMNEVTTIEPIPVLPISYGDAQPLLQSLSGPVAPTAWRGALPITYHVGGGAPVQVHLALKFDWASRPLYNVIARIPGSVAPEQIVMLGNHHDAWVNGASDPLSGQVALLETARSLGKLRATGWKPRRTILLAAWDGEEWGLLGSTEWVEKHMAELQSGGVFYLNSDSNDRGWIGASGSHSLQTFLMEVARDVQDPKTGTSVLARYIDRRIMRLAGSANGTVQPEKRPDADSSAYQGRDTALIRRMRSDTAIYNALRTALTHPDTTFAIGALGSGSDYTAFLDHAGVASANVGYGGESDDGFYHSIYDSFDSYRRFADTTFTYGVAQSQTTTTALMRMADAPLLPYEFTNAARTYRGYADDIAKTAKKTPGLEKLNLAGVLGAIDRLQNAAAHYETVFGRFSSLPEQRVARMTKSLAPINQKLARAEQALISDGGLPGRDWFRHLIYAPGFYTGYGVKTIPGVREAVEDKPDLAVAQREAERVSQALNNYAAIIESAATDLETIVK